MLDGMDDAHELEAASAGDPAAIESLLERHLPGLRAFLRLRMGGELRAKESASDLAQSTCREILEHMDRYRYRGTENFRYWLFATAQRKLQNRVAYWRADKRDVGLEAGRGDGSREESLAAFYGSLSTPSRSLMRRERIEALEAAFDRLSETHREVILLSRVVGLPHAEIARVMDRTEEATRSLLHRALAQLAEYLDGPEGS